jgi:hypothetical protein
MAAPARFQPQFQLHFVIEPEACAPERSGSPPGQEPLGVITSHGPSRECYTPCRRSRGVRAEAPGPAAAGCPQSPALSAERVRTALPSPAGAPTRLQRAVPGGGAEVVVLESPREISGDGGGPTETAQSKPALPGAGQKPETTEPEAVNDTARVITTEHFVRPLLRPARLLREIRAPAAKSLAALLLAGVPARHGARLGAGAALAAGYAI